MAARSPACSAVDVSVRDLTASLRFLSTRVSNVASMFAVLLVFCLCILASESSFFSSSPSLSNEPSIQPPPAPRLKPWEVDQGYLDEYEKEPTGVAVVDADDHGCDRNVESEALNKLQPHFPGSSDGCGPWESNIGEHPDDDQSRRQVVTAHAVAEVLGAKGLTNVETEGNDLSTTIVQEEEAKSATADKTAGAQADASAAEEGSREKSSREKQGIVETEQSRANTEGKEENDMSRQRTSSSAANEEVPPGCHGKLIYIYQLPDRFNTRYISNCKDRDSDTCQALSNSGMGQLASPPKPSITLDQTSTKLKPPHAWFETLPSSLEITFHARMKQHACLTPNPNKASLFYIPFYASLALRPNPNATPENGEGRDGDGDGTALVEWLKKEHPWYNRRYGTDHLLVLSRPVSHFAGGVMSGVRESNLMGLWHMKNVMVVGVEGNSHPELGNTFSIPYLSSFHPQSDEDIERWQKYVLQLKRKRRITYDSSSSGVSNALKKSLKKMCGKATSGCRSFSCGGEGCVEPRNAIRSFMKSDFCLLAPGTSPTSKGLFDCMLAGAIPVTFDERTSFDYTWHFPTEHSKFMVFVPRNEILKDNGTALLAQLWGYTNEEIAAMKANVVNLIPHIVYAAPGHNLTKHRDAFEVAVDRILQRVHTRVEQ